MPRGRPMRKGWTKPHEDDVRLEREEQEKTLVEEMEAESELQDDRPDVNPYEEEAEPWTERDLGAGWEYWWKKDGRLYRYTIVEEGIGVRVETSTEYDHGERRYWHKTRGPYIIDTNDPRLRERLVPDPGPYVEVKGPSGLRRIPADQFLGMINESQARRRQKAKRGAWE